MAFKIYVENNHIVVQDLVSDKEFRAASKEALFFKDRVSEDTYNTNGFFPEGLQGIKFSDIVDENETPFVNEQAFIDFFSANTGNFNSGGATPQYKKEYFAWLSQTYVQQTSGTLIVGHKYWIKVLNVLDDFTNVGGVNEENTRFIATGTTPTNYSNGSVLVDITLSSTQAEVIYNGLGFTPTYEYQSVGRNQITLPNTDYKKVYIPNIFRNDWQEQQVGIESYVSSDGNGNTIINLQQCDLGTILTIGGATEFDNYENIPYKIEIYN